MFTTGGLRQSDVWRLDRIEMQVAGLMSPIVCGAFGMVRGADGRPIIYSINNSASGTGTLNVCGVPVAPDNGCGVCELDETDEAVIEDVAAIIFEPCDFVTVEVDDATCGGSGSGSSGSGGGTDLGKAAHVRLGGKTEDVSFEVNPIFCPDTCEILTQTLTLCFRNGLYIGHTFGDVPECP